MKYFTQGTTKQNYGKLRRILMIAMLVMLTSGMAWAVNWPSSSNVLVDGKTYTLTTVGTNQFAVDGIGTYDNMAGFTIDGDKSITIVFNTTKPVTLIGQIKVQKGSLTMSLGSDYNSSVTLKNGYFGTAYQYQGLFFLPDGTNGELLNTRSITISGKAGNDPTTSSTFVAANQFVIDGGCGDMDVHQAQSGYYYIKSTSGTTTANPIFRAQSGTLTLSNVTIQNQWNRRGSTAFGAITVVTNKNDNINYSVALNMTQCWITKCAGNRYPGVSFQYTIKQYMGVSELAPKATIYQCKFSHCYSTTDSESISNGASGQLPVGAQFGAWISSNAAIRSVSHSKCNLEVTNCLVENNYGGGIRWQSVGANPMLVQNCTIQNNWTPDEGGGMLIKAGASIKNCQILNNTALKAGGGIFYTTFEETGSAIIYDQLAPRDAIVTLDDQTQIEGNHAGTDGGGIAIYARKIHPRNILYYYSFDEAGNETTNPLKVELHLEGATVEENTAGGNGGGVYISRSGNASFYPTTCNLLHGKIYNNSAGSNGGGTYIGQTEDPSGTSDMHPVQPITVRTGESTANMNMIIDKNTAGQSGGGVYVYVPHSVPTTVELLTNTYLINNEATAGNGGGVYVEEGDVRIKASMIGVDANGNSAPNKAKAGSGGGIYTNKGNIFVNYWDPTGGNNYKLRGETKATTIKNNIAQINGGGVNTHEGKVVMRGQSYSQPIVISNNEATKGSGGGIFCMGNTANSAYEYVRLISVNLTNNKAKDGGGNAGTNVTAGCGGGLYLQSGEINITKCKLQGNTAKLNGGGINNHSGSINVKGCTIGGLTSNNATAGNTASTGSGGGIFTIHGNVNITNHHESNASYFSEITYNTAKNNGGGITTRQGKVVATGDYSDDRTKCIKINNNSVDAGSGGGVFCLGDVSGTEDKYINFTHVDVIGNKAQNGSGTSQVQLEDGTNVTVTNGCGGGIYLQHGVIDIFNNNIQANLANKDGGGVYNHSGRIDVNGCLIGGEAADGNTAKRNGGGIYTHEGDIDIEDLIFQPGNTLVRLESKVRYNTAKENGGGINTHKGTITINSKQLDDQIEISRNTAKKGGGIYANEGTIIAYNAAIRNNTATENGGGINNHSGNIDLYGGMLSNNTAKEGNGGGAYTHVGDITIKPFNPGNQKAWLDLTVNDGTRIYNNIANNNGGGLNNHTGLIDLHYATLQNNTSTLGNGGGIYCEGPRAATTGFTIRLLRSMVNQNKTRGQDGTEAAPTGRGGGIYLQYGRIFAQGSTLTFNKANINGGGINNHQGNIRAYGCQISNNVATTGRGGGIYANQGLIVVGPSGVAGASIIENNSAGINGGGINNHEGDIQINGDIIQNNTAGENGGGIYLALGNITMNGGKINENEANKKGGGVYIGGTKNGGEGFIIQERKANTPVVEIIDVEPGSTTAVVHYHIVDDGNNSSFNNNIKYGLLNQSNTAYNISANGTDIGDVPGCRRDAITGLNAGNTYQVKVWVKNGNVDPYTADTTDLVSFTTLGNTPMVHTGTASGVTATSANVNGKLVYNGGADVLENAIGIQYSTSRNMSNHTNVYVSTATTDVPTFPEGGYYTLPLNFGNPADNYSTRKFYFRAIATNSANPAQTGYGELDSITLPKNTPSMGTNAVEYVFITDNGVPSIKFSYEMPNAISGNYSNYGFVLSYDDDPELKEDYTINKNEVVVAGNKFSVTVPLTLFYEGPHYPSFHYYVRAFATSAANEPSAMDITNYSITAATKFVIPDPDGKPVVRLVSISSIAQDSAVVRAIVVMKGNSAITRYGLCWTNVASIESTAMGGENVTVRQANATPNHYNNPAPANVNDSTYFTVAMTDLDLNTTYYLRVFATNATGEPTANDYVYGNEFNFTTLPANPPVVRLQVNDIQNNQATIQCTIDDGGEPVSEYGIYWREATATAFTQIQHTVSGTDTAPSSFEETLSELQSDKEYKVYAYARNGVGIYTGREVSFTTTYTKPSVSNPEYVAVSYDPVTRAQCIQVKGKVTDPGYYSPVQKLGVLYSTFPVPQPTLFNGSDEWDWGYSEQTTIEVGQDYTFFLTEKVQPNKYYYVRTYATSKASPTENDYQYSEGKNFNDPNYPEIAFKSYRFLTLPEVVSLSAEPTNFTATMTAKINCSDEDNHLVTRGFCWGENPNPVKGTNNFVEENTTPNATTAQTYSLTARGLASNEDYHWRAYVINRNENNGTETHDIAYSADSTFHTQGEFVITAEPLAYNAGTVNGSGYFRGYFGDDNEVTLAAEVNPSYTTYYEFGKWVEVVNNVETEVTGAGSTYTFNASETAHYKALFKAQIDLYYYNGTVTGTVDGNNFVNGEKYLYGTSITLTATPNTGYVFGYWTKNGEVIEDAEATYTFTVEDAATYSAYFYYGRNLPEEPRQGASQHGPYPRDIYPAPAHEPWDWDEVVIARNDAIQTDSLLDNQAPLAMTDTLVPTRATTTAPVNKPSINNNSAEYGGGVYVEHNQSNPAKIVFAGGGDNEHVGTINNNTATEAGGGIYISQGASMQMKGHCQVNSNHVPAGKKGGGIYLDGTLLVGNQASDPANAHALQVNWNWIGDGAYTEATRNNVYLPTDPILTGDALHKMRVITLLSDISGVTNDGKDGETGTKIGLSVDRGFREVIYADRTTHSDRDLWLSRLIPGGSLNGAIFDDANKYYALHVSQSDGMFDQDYDYLWGCWTSVVTKDPQAIDPETEEMYFPLPAGVTQHYKVEGDTWHIYTNYGLAWFSSIVNGLNKGNAAPSNTNEGPVTTLNAVIENDLDMSKYFWVPLGGVEGSTSSGQTIVFDDGGQYNGTFDGQGHIIKGLICTYMTGIFKYGLFGTVGDNGVVKNTFVDDYRFTTYKQKQETSQGSGQYEDYNPTYYMGGIAAQVTGSGIIKNCEARGEMKTPMCDADNTCVGGLVGLINSTTGTEVHSSMAMPEIVGTTIGSTVNPFTAKNVGGLVGKINANNMLKNSFANMKLGAVDGNVKVGGLVGNNLGTVENCYARLQNTYDNNAPTNFYWFAGANTGTITYCYAPDRSDCPFDYVPSETTGVSKHGKYGLTTMSEYGTSSVRRRKYQFDQKDQQIELDLNQTNTHVVNGIFNGLLPTLNHWVESANTPSTPDPGAKEETTEPKYSTWSRTMASPLNDDYPILEFADFDCLASTDNIYLEYKADLDDMIEKYNGIENGGNIYLYASGHTNAGTTNPELVEQSTDEDVRVYIDENVGILQDAGSNINARVGVTLDNSKGTTEIGGEKYDWHMFSSALKSVSMGLKYHTNETGYPGVDNYYILNNFNTLSTNGIPHDYYVNRINMDPPKTTWFKGNVCVDSVGYFPINTPYGTWRDQPAGENGSFDFYCYGEAYYQHWINFKREGREGLYDHWRQDPDPDNFKHYQIKYPNESTFTQAKGYMVGINEKHSDLENGGYERNPERRNMMMADGELNNGDIEYKATYTTNPEATAYDFEVRGCNLIGNPYQSYLNFDEFIDKNSGKVLGNTYFILDADAGRYVSYTTDASENPIAAPCYIHPHQGFLVKVRENQTLTFTNAMRSATGNAVSYFRSGRLNYPLVNLICTDATGKCDATTIEINRPDVGGGQKMKGIRTGNALVYVHLDGVDYQTAFAPVGITSAPVRFDVLEDGVFTMRWGTMHGDFSYLHLIDNLTGMDVDCLRQSEYHFEAKTTDYKSRFKLVFECTGVEEQEDDGSGGPSTFAFRMGDELVINGEGYLQVFDLNGRQLLAKQVYGTQNTVGLPKVAAGLYVLRLTTNNQSKTQKMVIE